MKEGHDLGLDTEECDKWRNNSLARLSWYFFCCSCLPTKGFFISVSISRSPMRGKIIWGYALAKANKPSPLTFRQKSLETPSNQFSTVQLKQLAKVLSCQNAKWRGLRNCLKLHHYHVGLHTTGNASDFTTSLKWIWMEYNQWYYEKEPRFESKFRYYLPFMDV